MSCAQGFTVSYALIAVWDMSFNDRFNVIVTGNSLGQNSDSVRNVAPLWPTSKLLQMCDTLLILPVFFPCLSWSCNSFIAQSDMYYTWYSLTEILSRSYYTISHTVTVQWTYQITVTTQFAGGIKWTLTQSHSVITSLWSVLHTPIVWMLQWLWSLLLVI